MCVCKKRREETRTWCFLQRACVRAKCLVPSARARVARAHAGRMLAACVKSVERER